MYILLPLILSEKHKFYFLSILRITTSGKKLPINSGDLCKGKNEKHLAFLNSTPFIVKYNIHIRTYININAEFNRFKKETATTIQVKK
jgi:uncharacterized protein YydD (DUF2326 family)